MIVQCDQCSTRFKLDDAKVKESGVKVRCSKCKSVFIVRKEMPPEETDFDSLLSGLGGPTPETAEPKPSEAPLGPFGIDEQTAAAEAEVGGKEEITAKAGEETFEPKSQAAGEEEPFSFGDEPFTDWQSAVPPAKMEKAGSEPGEEHEFDFSAVMFDEAPGAAGSEPLTATEPPVEFELESFAPVQPEEPAITDAEEKKFSLKDEPDAAYPQSEIKIDLSEEPEETLDFGEIDFGESVAATPPAEVQIPMDLTGAAEKQPIQSAAPSATVQKAEVPVVSTIAVSPEDELPPFSSNSRRKVSFIVPIAVIAITILFVIALVGAGFYFLNEGPAAFNKLGLGFLAEWAGIEAVEEGGIIIRKPIGTFLENKEAGEIFVVSGEAFNNFKKPRASIQVKATIYGPKGEVMQQKIAYCGNALSREQLGIQPMEKIEAAMLNQFGDSLANLGVQPGKAIPFVVVFTNVSKDAGEFGIEVAGSTVASQ